MSWDRFFVVVHRVSSLLVVAFAICILAILVQQRLMMREFDREMPAQKFGGKYERTLPYSGQEIETAEGSLVTVFQDDGNTGQRVELGGITVTNPSSGEFVELAPNGSGGVVQFELIFDQGEGGHVVGYLATIATEEQYEQGRQDLVVGALPAMTRSVVASNIRYSDLPRIRGDGNVGLLMWPEEGEAYLVAIRLEDGEIIEKSKVKLPILKGNQLSQGPGNRHFALGRGDVPDEAPGNMFQK